MPALDDAEPEKPSVLGSETGSVADIPKEESPALESDTAPAPGHSVEPGEDSDVVTGVETPPTPVGELDTAVGDLFREETISLYKRQARRTLNKYRKDPPPQSRTHEPAREREAPIVSEKMSTARKCETCYFCASAKRVGGSAWCHCTNPGRSSETVSAASWVRSRINAPCWKRCEAP